MFNKLKQTIKDIQNARTNRIVADTYRMHLKSEFEKGFNKSMNDNTYREFKELMEANDTLGKILDIVYDEGDTATAAKMVKKTVNDYFGLATPD